MRSILHTFLALASLTSAAAVSSSACNTNSCLRQVLVSTVAGRSACSTYQTTWVTATTTVSTVTRFTSTPTDRPTSEPPRTVPTFASSCSKAADFRSACTCIGSTSTVMTATTVSVVATAVCSTVVLQAMDGPGVNNYLVDKDDYGGPMQRIRGKTLDIATRYEFRDSRFWRVGSTTDLLYGTPFVQGQLSLGNRWQTQQTGENAKYQSYPLRCEILSPDNRIYCVTEVGGADIFSVGSRDPLFFTYFRSPTLQDEYTVPFNLRAIPAC